MHEDEGEMVCTVMCTLVCKKSKSRQTDVSLSSAQTPEYSTAPKQQILEKTLRENSKLPPRHPLVKNEHTTRCVHKSVLMWACLHTCVYELSWVCILSLHESAVITQWRCPWGGSFYIWLRATSPHFIVSCAWQKNCCVCLYMSTDGSRVWAHMCVRV